MKLHQTVPFLLFMLLTSALSVGQTEKLLIFISDTTHSYADREFVKSYLPSLREYAMTDEVEVVIRPAAQGVLPSTTCTPAIYFYTGRELKYYNGRYKELNRIQNFIRSSRSIPLSEATDTISHCYTLRDGKMHYTMPIKVSPVTGKGKNLGMVRGSLDRLFQKDFSGASYQSQATHPYFGRKYYFDFHPYVNGKYVYISVEVYSEFHCKEPIYSSPSPLVAKADEVVNLVLSAKRAALHAMFQNIDHGQYGDAHQVIPTDHPSLSLESLDIQVGSTQNTNQAPFPDQLPDHWVFEKALNPKTPIIQFGIPNTIYIGEINELSADLRLSTMQGFATALQRTLFMGDQGLEESVRERILTDQFPSSTLRLNQVIKEPNTPINRYQTYEYLLQGELSFVGKTIDEEVLLRLTPFVDQDNVLKLYCNAEFKLLLQRQFGIESGVGDGVEEDTVEFYLNFVMKSVN